MQDLCGSSQGLRFGSISSVSVKGGASERLPHSKSWMCCTAWIVFKLYFTSQLLAFHAGML